MAFVSLAKTAHAGIYPFRSGSRTWLELLARLARVPDILVPKDPAPSINARHQRSGYSSYTSNRASSLDQQLGDLRSGHVFCPNHDDPRRMPPYGIELGSAVADVPVLRECDPSRLSNKCDPILIRSVIREVIVMYLDLHACRAKRVGNDVSSEIPIQKEYGLFMPPFGARIGWLLRFLPCCAHSRAPTGLWTPLPCSARRSSGWRVRCRK